GSTEAGADQVTVSLWDVATAKRITRFKVPTRAAFALTFAPDGKTLLGSGPEPQVRLWDTATGKQLFAESGHAGAITSLSFTPDGRTLVSGADDGTLRMWDVAAARCPAVAGASTPSSSRPMARRSCPAAPTAVSACTIWTRANSAAASSSTTSRRRGVSPSTRSGPSPWRPTAGRPLRGARRA